MSQLLRDKRGASTVTQILLLPIFILILLGAVQIWQIIATRQSLNVNVNRTATCLSNYYEVRPCEDFLEEALIDTGLGSEISSVRYYTYTTENELVLLPIRGEGNLRSVVGCGQRFAVEVTLPSSRSVVIPFLPARRMTLTERKSSYIDCRQRRGIEEGTPIAPLN